MSSIDISSHQQAIAASGGYGTDGNILILQNIYADNLLNTFDRAFVPYEGRRNALTTFREIGLFMRLYHNGIHLCRPYVGIVSPRFGQKLELPGSTFIDFVDKNPGYDVYFINPFPQEGYYFFNVWEQCEYHHQGCTMLAQELVDEAKLDINLGGLGRNSNRNLLYCNYWVGNEKFWNRFMIFTVKLVNALYQFPNHVFDEYFFSDPGYPEHNSKISFIFERLFSTLLLIDPDIRALGFPHSEEQFFRLAEMNDPAGLPFLRSVKHAVDEIDARGEYSEDDVRLLRTLMRGRGLHAPV